MEAVGRHGRAVSLSAYPVTWGLGIGVDPGGEHGQEREPRLRLPFCSSSVPDFGEWYDKTGLRGADRHRMRASDHRKCEAFRAVKGYTLAAERAPPAISVALPVFSARINTDSQTPRNRV